MGLASASNESSRKLGRICSGVPGWKHIFEIGVRIYHLVENEKLYGICYLASEWSHPA